MVTLNAMVQVLIDLFGIALTVAIAGAVIWFVREPLKRVLQQLIGDKAVAEVATRFVLILLGLYGLRAALEYVTQPQLSRLFDGLTNLLVGMTGVIQWVANIAALLFIGYSLQARLGTAEKTKE